MIGKADREEAPMNPSTMTPREVDEQLAALYMARLTNNQAQMVALHRIHSAVGSRVYVKGTGWGSKGHYVNQMTDAAAVAEDRRRLAAGEIEPWNIEYAEQRLAALEACEREDERITAAQEPLSAEYRSRPWSRYFRVTSSPGHIHSSMDCSTCYPTTEYGWRPDLSGKTEAEAVKACGPALCSICFPLVRVEWTQAKLTKTGKVSTAR